MSVKSIIKDIEFAEENSGEFGGRIAPMLRYVAGINMEATAADFVEAAVQKGYHAATAKTCFYKGRKFMRDLDEEVSQPVKAKKQPKPKGAHVKCPAKDCGEIVKLEGEPDHLGRFLDLVCPKCGVNFGATPKFPTSN